MRCSIVNAAVSLQHPHELIGDAFSVALSSSEYALNSRKLIVNNYMFLLPDNKFKPNTDIGNN